MNQIQMLTYIIQASVKNRDHEMKYATNEPFVKEVQLTNRDYPAEKSDVKEVAEEANRAKFLMEPEKNKVSISCGDVGTSGEAVMEPSSSLRSDEMENTTTKMAVMETGALNRNCQQISVSTIRKGNEIGLSKGAISAAVHSEGT